MPHQEQPPISPKTFKELALTRHGEAIQQALTAAKTLGEQPAVHELLRHVRKHMEVQRIIARDLLGEEHE